MTVPESASSNPPPTSEIPGAPSWGHRTTRLFIGPLPHKLLPVMYEVVQVTGNDNEPFDASYASAVRDVLDRNAHAFFLRQGGRAQDWDEHARESMRGELMKRWQECPWTRFLHTHHRLTGATHWVGNTFEVGSILGVNVLDSHAPTPPVPSVVPETPQQESQARYASTTALSSQGPHSYWTARSHLSPPSPHDSSSTTSLPEQHGGELSAFSSGSPLLATASAPSFPTDHAPRQGSDAPRSILKHPTGTSSSKPSFKRRGVSLLDQDAKHKVPLRPKGSKPSLSGVDVRRPPLEDEQDDEGPVSPAAVLARTGSEVVECSAGATVEVTPSQQAPGDIFLRGLWNPFEIFLTSLIISKIECLSGCVIPSQKPFQVISTRLITAKRPTCVMKAAWNFWSCGGRIC